MGERERERERETCDKILTVGEWQTNLQFVVFDCIIDDVFPGAVLEVPHLVRNCFVASGGCAMEEDPRRIGLYSSLENVEPVDNGVSLTTAVAYPVRLP